MAVVGSTRFDNPGWRDIASEIIIEQISLLEVPDRRLGVVTGGAAGIDTLGVEISQDLWLRKVVYPPKNACWEPEGYRERNELVALTATWGLGIRCVSAKTFGTGWTINRIEELGKPVVRMVVHVDVCCRGCYADSDWSTPDSACARRE